MSQPILQSGKSLYKTLKDNIYTYKVPSEYGLGDFEQVMYNNENMTVKDVVGIDDITYVINSEGKLFKLLEDNSGFEEIKTADNESLNITKLKKINDVIFGWNEVDNEGVQTFSGSVYIKSSYETSWRQLVDITNLVMFEIFEHVDESNKTTYDAFLMNKVTSSVGTVSYNLFQFDFDTEQLMPTGAGEKTTIIKYINGRYFIIQNGEVYKQMENSYYFEGPFEDASGNIIKKIKDIQLINDNVYMFSETDTCLYVSVNDDFTQYEKASEQKLESKNLQGSTVVFANEKIYILSMGSIFIYDTDAKYDNLKEIKYNFKPDSVSSIGDIRFVNNQLFAIDGNTTNKYLYELNEITTEGDEHYGEYNLLPVYSSGESGTQIEIQDIKFIAEEIYIINSSGNICVISEQEEQANKVIYNLTDTGVAASALFEYTQKEGEDDKKYVLFNGDSTPKVLKVLHPTIDPDTKITSYNSYNVEFNDDPEDLSHYASIAAPTLMKNVNKTYYVINGPYNTLSTFSNLTIDETKEHKAVAIFTISKTNSSTEIANCLDIALFGEQLYVIQGDTNKQLKTLTGPNDDGYYTLGEAISTTPFDKIYNNINGELWLATSGGLIYKFYIKGTGEETENVVEQITYNTESLDQLENVSGFKYLNGHMYIDNDKTDDHSVFVDLTDQKEPVYKFQRVKAQQYAQKTGKYTIKTFKLSKDENITFYIDSDGNLYERQANGTNETNLPVCTTEDGNPQIKVKDIKFIAGKFYIINSLDNICVISKAGEDVQPKEGDKVIYILTEVKIDISGVETPIAASTLFEYSESGIDYILFNDRETPKVLKVLTYEDSTTTPLTRTYKGTIEIKDTSATPTTIQNYGRFEKINNEYYIIYGDYSTLATFSGLNITTEEPPTAQATLTNLYYVNEPENTIIKNVSLIKSLNSQIYIIQSTNLATLTATSTPGTYTLKILQYKPAADQDPTDINYCSDIALFGKQLYIIQGDNAIDKYLKLLTPPTEAETLYTLEKLSDVKFDEMLIYNDVMYLFEPPTNNNYKLVKYNNEDKIIVDSKLEDETDLTCTDFEDCFMKFEDNIYCSTQVSEKNILFVSESYKKFISVLRDDGDLFELSSTPLYKPTSINALYCLNSGNLFTINAEKAASECSFKYNSKDISISISGSDQFKEFNNKLFIRTNPTQDGGSNYYFIQLNEESDNVDKNKFDFIKIVKKLTETETEIIEYENNTQYIIYKAYENEGTDEEPSWGEKYYIRNTTANESKVLLFDEKEINEFLPDSFRYYEIGENKYIYLVLNGSLCRNTTSYNNFLPLHYYKKTYISEAINQLIKDENEIKYMLCFDGNIYTPREDNSGGFAFDVYKTGNFIKIWFIKDSLYAGEEIDGGSDILYAALKNKPLAYTDKPYSELLVNELQSMDGTTLKALMIQLINNTALLLANTNDMRTDIQNLYNQIATNSDDANKEPETDQPQNP